MACKISKVSITAYWKKLVVCNVAYQLSPYTERHILVLSMQTLSNIGCWKARPPQFVLTWFTGWQVHGRIFVATWYSVMCYTAKWRHASLRKNTTKEVLCFFRIYLYTYITLIEGYEAACYFVNAYVLRYRADQEPLPGPRDFVHARRKKDWVKVSSEVAQDHRAWCASVRDVVNAIGDASSNRSEWMSTQVQVTAEM